ncbi:MAG: glycosyltransferase family 4 protein [Azoarcus sp.]|nr:glycosyltransferase family 4 protein [Azoarcus sp.]
MRVAIDVDVVRFPLTGIGRYVYELVRHLESEENGIELDLFAGPWRIAALPSADVAAQASGTGRRGIGVVDWLSRQSLVVGLHRAAIDAAQGAVLRRRKPDLFHGPRFFLPHFDGPRIVTIHDLSMFVWPQCHPSGRLPSVQRAVERAVSSDAHILTDSDFIRGELIERFGLPGERVSAIPLACGEEFRLREAEATAPVLQRHGLARDGYCLYSGTIEPRKNLHTLISAYEALPVDVRRRWPLVLCGYYGWNSDDVHGRIDRAAREGWVRYLGYVAADELPVLFSGARLFAFPSLYEGFGLPVLEAMASGIPVVCSNSASLPEVVGGAGLTVDAHDVDGLSSALTRGLTDEAWRTSARVAGLARAARLSWASCARRTADVYRQVIAGQG